MLDLADLRPGRAVGASAEENKPGRPGSGLARPLTIRPPSVQGGGLGRSGTIHGPSSASTIATDKPGHKRGHSLAGNLGKFASGITRGGASRDRERDKIKK